MLKQSFWRQCPRSIVFALLVVHQSLGQSFDIEGLAREGQQFTEQQVADAERDVEKNPDQIDQRFRLAAYYWRNQFHSDVSKDAHVRHVLWFIQNKPASQEAGSVYVRLDHILQPRGYGQAEKLWLEHLQRDEKNIAIITNAAAFFTIANMDRTIDLYKKACALEAENPEWAERLGHAYELQSKAMGKEAGTATAKLALEAYESALKKRSGIRRYYLLSHAAKAALAAEEFEKARTFANELLDAAVEQGGADWNYGNAVHHGNLILDELAFKEGNLELAEQHLIKAGKTPGSPQLNSFGPNMVLARKLLEKTAKRPLLST